MWKILIIALACIVLYKLVTNDRGVKAKADQKEQDRKVARGEMVKDPICGSYVDVEGSISVKDGTKNHVFCSYECRQKFLDELEKGGREIPRLTQNQADEEE